MDNMSILRIKYESLSDAEKKVADLIIQENGQILDYTLTEIAKQSDVSEATVVRFFRSLGYERFLDLKVDLLHSKEDSSKLIHGDIRSDDSIETIVSKSFHGSIQSLEDTLATFNFDGFSRTIELLNRVKNVLIIGIGSSWWACQELNQRFLRLGLKSQAQVDCYSQLSQAALLSDKDVLIVLSQMGEAESLLRVVEEAKIRSCPVVAITGQEKSALGKLADIVLLSISNEMPLESLSSRLAQHLIVQTIYITLAMQNIEIASKNENEILEAVSRRKTNIL